MSVVIGKVTKDKVIMASDSQQTNGYSKDHAVSSQKVTRIGSTIFGGVGLSEENELLAMYLTNKKFPKGIGELILYISEFYKWRDNVNPKIQPKEDGDISSAQFLIADYGNLYYINDTFIDTIKVGCYTTIGQGAEYAIGALDAGAGIRKAVEIACKNCISCGMPIVYMENKR